jgi:2-polyprenyl-3-methyl-5-hydroxy-6-metoxy-1,4-benzoquinol methylase
VITRHSNGLEQFFTYIRNDSGLRLLDLGGANQANVSFITSLGHRLTSEDLLRNAWHHWAGASASEPVTPEQAAAFLDSNLDFPENSFDGVLVWDALEHLEHALLGGVIERLLKIVRPGSYMLAVFHAQERFETEPMQYSFRIQDARTIVLAPKTRKRPHQVFNNRTLEKLFSGFESLKFFLTRDSLREVIIKR